jgi:hypothetical protein
MRIIAAVIVFIFSMVICQTVIGAFVPGIPGIFVFLLAAAASWWIARYVWRQLASTTVGPWRAAAVGAWVVGGIGFCGGFFGPMIFAPQANQGPLLGIFITGPLGFLLGGVGGYIYGWMRKSAKGEP